MVEWSRPFSAIRKDPHWKRKLVVGVLLNFIPYVGTVWVIGWEMEYMRNVAWGDDERLPDWSDFSGQALLGLKGFVAVLPYSLLLSVLVTPLIFFMALAGGAMGEGVGFVISMVAMLTVLMGVTVLLFPLTASAQLRVTLYGTIESGFQFKELWRHIRETRTELNRAWGYSALNMGISLAVMALFAAVIGALVAIGAGSSTETVLVLFAVGTIVYLTYIVLGMALSLYLGLANMHYFGTFGRVAYRLDEAREYYAAAAAAATQPAQ